VDRDDVKELSAIAEALQAEEVWLRDLARIMVPPMLKKKTRWVCQIEVLVPTITWLGAVDNVIMVVEIHSTTSRTNEVL
jgi:hypothetical protein